MGVSGQHHNMFIIATIIIQPINIILTTPSLLVEGIGNNGNKC